MRLGGGLRTTADVQPNVLTIESRGASGLTLRGDCIGPLDAHPRPLTRGTQSTAAVAPSSNPACGVPPFGFADSLSDMDSPHEAGHKTFSRPTVMNPPMQDCAAEGCIGRSKRARLTSPTGADPYWVL